MCDEREEIGIQGSRLEITRLCFAALGEGIRSKLQASVVLAIFPALLCLVGSAHALPIPVLQSGDVQTGDAPKSGKNWFGLYKVDAHYLVAPVSIQTHPYFHELVDSKKDKNEESKWTGRTVNAVLDREYSRLIPSDAEPLILVQLGELKEGYVTTSFPDNGSEERRSPGSFAPLESIELTLGKELRYRYVLENDVSRGGCITLRHDAAAVDASKELKEKNRVEGNLPRSYNWGLRDPLFLGTPYCSKGNHSYPTLVWAGDFDRDSKLDLIFDIDHNSTYTRTLFLSSFADVDRYVKLVGQFTRPSGC